MRRDWLACLRDRFRLNGRYNAPTVTVDWRLVGLHGAVLSVAASAVIMGALRYNPRLFLRHFPAAVRASQPPFTAHEKTVGRIIGALLMLVFVGGPILSASIASAQHALTRLDVGLHAFLVGTIGNAVDWLVLDELWIGIGQPRWALPPGVKPDDVPFSHWQHFRGFLTGSVLFLLVALLASVLVPRS